jgi:type II secretory pathway component PulF
MRTTVTLDADTEALVRRRMRERGVSFKQAVNDAIREGATGRTGRSTFRTETAALGQPAVNLDRALQLAAELEDEELVRKMRVGK